MDNSLPPAPPRPLWQRLAVIDTVIAVVLLSFCGLGGGFFMLIALNGFSESEATPILIVFVLLVLGGSVFVNTAVNLLVIHRRQKTVPHSFRTAVLTAAVTTLVVFAIGPLLLLLRYLLS